MGISECAEGDLDPCWRRSGRGTEGRQAMKEGENTERQRERESWEVRSMVLGKSLGSDRRGSNAAHVMTST